jgi:hypothetical protein
MRVRGLWVKYCSTAFSLMSVLIYSLRFFATPHSFAIL